MSIEKVRSHPQNIFRSKSVDGVMHAFELLINIFTLEALRGYGDKIIVTLFEDKSISIRDFGRGISLGTKEDPKWYEMFCVPKATSKWAYGYQLKSIMDENEDLGLNREYEESEYELHHIQFVSEYMEIHSFKDGFEKVVCFKKGLVDGDLELKESSEPNGSYIIFKFDNEVFDDTALPRKWLKKHLMLLCALNPGISYVLNIKDVPFEKDICYRSLRHYIYETDINFLVTDVYEEKTNLTGKDRYNKPEYTTDIKTALYFQKRDNGEIVRLHNGITISDTLTEVVTDKIIDSVFEHIDLTDKRFLENSYLIHWLKTRLKQHLVLIISSTAPSGITNWGYQHNCINNSMISDIIEDLFGYEFELFVETNKRSLSLLINELVESELK